MEAGMSTSMSNIKGIYEKVGSLLKYTYVAEPTETRARINEVRKQMMDSNIRNVFDKKIRVKDLKNYNGSWNTYNLYKTEDADGSNFNMKPNPLQEIIEGYQLNNSNKSKPNRKDWKQVKKMFNTISDNSNNNYNNYAKYGGEITFKNYSKFNK